MTSPASDVVTSSTYPLHHLEGRFPLNVVLNRCLSTTNAWQQHLNDALKKHSPKPLAWMPGTGECSPTWKHSPAVAAPAHVACLNAFQQPPLSFPFCKIEILWSEGKWQGFLHWPVGQRQWELLKSESPPPSTAGLSPYTAVSLLYSVTEWISKRNSWFWRLRIILKIQQVTFWQIRYTDDYKPKQFK